MTEDTITVLWIEDNPLTNAISVYEFVKRHPEFLPILNPQEGDNRYIPGISLNNDHKNDDGSDILPLLKGDEHRFFRLRILQNLEEVREYYAAVLSAEDTQGPRALGALDHVVPDIVAFDYNMGEGNSISQPSMIKYTAPFRKVREFYNPNFSLLKTEPFFERPENRQYSKDMFLMRINHIKGSSIPAHNFQTDRKHLEDDELGLFAGVSVTKLFRNHACVGVPITANKPTTESLHAYAKFFEWMNESDLVTMFGGKSRGSKDWKLILIEAVKQLRKRILVQLEGGKLFIHTEQLFKLYDAFREKNTQVTEQVLIYSTLYGERRIPLAGLFFDVDEQEKQQAIVKFLGQIMNIVSQKSGFEASEFTTMLNFSNRLWQAYSETEGDFEKRYKLSEFVSWQMSDNETLQERIDREQLSALVRYFDYRQGDKVLKRNTLELTDIKDKPMRRGVVVLTYLNLLNQYSFFKEQMKFAEKNSFVERNVQVLDANRQIFLEPRDLLLALFPIPAGPVILDIHQVLIPRNLQSQTTQYGLHTQAIRDLDLRMNGSCELENLNESEKYLARMYAAERNIQLPNFLTHG